MKETLNCRHFNGYKPCGLSVDCSQACESYDRVLNRILIVHLGALGAVLRATSILPAIHRKFPKAHVTWVTSRPAEKLLHGNGLLDRVLTLDTEDLLALESLSFDVGICIDKSPTAFGAFKRAQVDYALGFGIDPGTGAVIPLNSSATPLWNLGLSNQKKFFENVKPETQLMVEAFDLGRYQKDEYILQLSVSEQDEVESKRGRWILGDRPIIGINTGCAATIKAKRLSVEAHRRLIQVLRTRFPENSIVLLGGPEDEERNREISQGLGVVLSDTTKGLRDGLTSVGACDVVISGDSLGMHMAIALKKWVIPWFGPTCAHEIELYGRGSAILADIPCAPCWKRDCGKEVMCYDKVDFNKIIVEVKKGLNWSILLSRQHFLEMRS